jgi:hypothetical protein
VLKNKLNLIQPSLLIFGILFIIFTAYSNFVPLDMGLPKLISIYSQNSTLNSIQILSTSSHIDNAGNFHIIGEVNNTSENNQGLVNINSTLYDSFNNVIGHSSTYSTIESLRPGELSPFEIVINNPQQANKINYYALFTSSQASQEKPANLLLNLSNIYFDHMTNPHIAGNITNLGQSPISSIKVIGTFYNNLSHVIGTNITNINYNNLSNGQSVPFDLGINDNRTKLQSKFFSLNTESPQSAMETPLNLKWIFPNPDANNTMIDNQILEDGEKKFILSPINEQLFTPQQSNNIPSGTSSNIANTNNQLYVTINFAEDPIVRGNDQTVTVSDLKTNEKISGAEVKFNVIDSSGKSYLNEDKKTNSDGEAKFTFEIGTGSETGLFKVIAGVVAKGYESISKETNFKVISNNNNNVDDNNNKNDNPKQRGEYLVDNNGQHYYDKNNCSEEKGSSGGDFSECQDAEKEVKQEEKINDINTKEGNDINGQGGDTSNSDTKKNENVKENIDED